MTASQIVLKDVGLKFKVYEDKGTTLKELLIHKLMNRRVGAQKEFWALKNINLKIDSGDRLGIIGNNGAGKSTLLKVITKIYSPTEGSIITQGKIAPLIELGAGFNLELSGYENIFLNAAVMGVPKKVMKDKIESILEFTELQDFIYLPVKYYSTGMYMKLAFTIATEISPEILIIDELFAGGDISFIDKATQRMHRLMDNSHIVIMVSHSLELIQQVCNRVILIDRGRIMADGKPDDIIAHYRKANGL